jgi:hypothetical protein
VLVAIFPLLLVRHAEDMAEFVEGGAHGVTAIRLKI